MTVKGCAPMSNPFSLIFGKIPVEAISQPFQRNQILEAFDSEPASQQIYMITGVRGSGKTVLMTEVCEHYRSNEQWLVIELNPNASNIPYLGLTTVAINCKVELSFIESKVYLQNIHFKRSNKPIV